MDCVIKIIKGPEEGLEFTCTGQETIIGRSPRSQLRLTSPSISYEHAMITRNGAEFFIENLSAAGTFLREERIVGKARLRTKDQYRLGQDTTLRIEALPLSSSGGTKKRALLVGVVVMIFVLIGVVLLDPFSPNSRSGNWKSAYAHLDEWAENQIAAGQLPPDMLPLLHDAWRLESAGNRSDSAQQWLRLSILLDHEDDKIHLKDANAAHRHAIDRLLNPDPKLPALNDDEMGAALLQFVTRMADRN